MDEALEGLTWPTDLSGDPDRVLGSEIYLHVVAVEEWVRRRVEKVVFLDDVIAQRNVSIDFCLTERRPSFRLSDNESCLVPLALLDKRPLISFDLRDESGSAVPVLTSAENGWAAFSTLIALAEFVLEENGVAELPADIVDDLRSIAVGKRHQAYRFLAQMWDWAAASGRARRLLMEDAEFSDLIEDLSQKFLLIAPIPWKQSQRRLLKFSYVQDIGWEKVTLPMRLGWQPTVAIFDLPAVDEGASYHFEVSAPRGLTIASVELQDESTGQGFVRTEEARSRAHVYVSDVEAGTSCIARVALQPVLPGLIRSAVLFALVLGPLLSLLFWRADELRLGPANALLLAVPGLVGLFLVRPGEHFLVSRILVTLRFIVVALGFLPFLGSTFIIARFGGLALFLPWLILLVFAWLCVLVISISYLRIRVHAAGF